jgi:hypothetical protein
MQTRSETITTYNKRFPRPVSKETCKKIRVGNLMFPEFTLAMETLGLSRFPTRFLSCFLQVSLDAGLGNLSLYNVRFQALNFSFSTHASKPPW